MASSPGLFYGVGATKAGTSWLYDYLKEHPQVHFRGIKELHYWDTRRDQKELRVFSDSIRDYRRGLEEKLLHAVEAKNAKWEATIRHNIDEASEALTVLQSLPGQHGAYLEYLQAQAGEARLTGEITPSYGLLNEETLAEMQSPDPDARFLYLLRDPVDRLWSHIRMVAHRRSGQDGRFQYRIEYMLECAVEGSEFEIMRRSDYTSTIKKLQRIVKPSYLMIAFFEEMFTPDGLAKICAFLGIDPTPADFNTKVLHSEAGRMTEASRSMAARALKEQYDYVEATLGRMPPNWLENRRLALTA